MLIGYIFKYRFTETIIFLTLLSFIFWGFLHVLWGISFYHTNDRFLKGTSEVFQLVGKEQRNGYEVGLYKGICLDGDVKSENELYGKSKNSLTLEGISILISTFSILLLVILVGYISERKE